VKYGSVAEQKVPYNVSSIIQCLDLLIDILLEELDTKEEE
jgi:hypothetical protein